MKTIDLEKSYGTIYNHSIAQYEQDGVLYGFDLKPLSMEKEIIENKPPEEIEDYLKELLAGGAILQSNIKKESEMMGFNWFDVQNAGLKLNVTKYKVGVANMWKLPGE